MKKNGVPVLIFLLFFIIPFSACVGPADPVHGLVENMSVVVNTTDAFTYSLRGKDFSFEEAYDVKLTLMENQSYSVTLVLSEKVGADTTTIIIYGDQNQILNQFYMMANTVRVDAGNTVAPKKVELSGNKFTGILDLVLARD